MYSASRGVTSSRTNTSMRISAAYSKENRCRNGMPIAKEYWMPCTTASKVEKAFLIYDDVCSAAFLNSIHDLKEKIFSSSDMACLYECFSGQSKAPHPKICGPAGRPNRIS